MRPLIWGEYSQALAALNLSMADAKHTYSMFSRTHLVSAIGAIRDSPMDVSKERCRCLSPILNFWDQWLIVKLFNNCS